MDLKNTAPVNMMGAVSPAARLTWRIRPVRMPLMELGSTTARMVCQRVAPTFQQASRKLRGTLASASRVLAMMTGKRHDGQGQGGRDDRVTESGGIDKGAQPKQGVDNARHARQVDDCHVDEPIEPVVPGVSFKYTAGRTPIGAETASDRTTR